jgi:predicted metal-dependent phosphoesterase TrpH
VPDRNGSSPTFDLQSHSRHSDGALAPAEVVAAAAQAGVQLLALSDHDNVDGVPEALAAGEREGVAIVPAVEITAVDGPHADLHVLGYLVDPHDERLLERLGASRAEREGRSARIVERIKELGFAVDEEVLEARAAQGKTIGRPHIAQAVFGHPANVARLAAEGHGDFTAFLVAYLIEGKAAFVARQGPSVPEAIAAIHDAGGVAVWAHPFWDIPGADEVLATVARFRDQGLDGVEVFYTTHTREQTELLADRCEELDLLTTGSADFHGPEHRQFRHFRAFSTFGREPRLGPIDLRG